MDNKQDSKQINKISQSIKRGEVGVFPTDTIYGILGSAFFRKTVERIYKIKKRSTNKPFIILISSMFDLEKFKIVLNREQRYVLNKVWPGTVSVILPCKYKKFFYLHKGLNSLAFRLPKNKRINQLLKLTGPMVAPSVNPEGLKPALNIHQAKKYFSENLDFYFSGKVKNSPSSLIKITNREIVVLREGLDFKSLKKQLNKLN